MDSALEAVSIDIPHPDPGFLKIAEHLTRALGDNFIIMGGAVRDQFLKGRFTTDVDVFTDNRVADAAMTACGFSGQGRMTGRSPNPYTWDTGIEWVSNFKADFVTRGTWNGGASVPVQVIVCKEPVLALAVFDWAICQMGWSPALGFFATRQALEDAKNRTLTLYKCHAWRKTVSRMAKLCTRLGLVPDPVSVAILHHRATLIPDHESLAKKSLAQKQAKKQELLDRPDTKINTQNTQWLMRAAGKNPNPHALVAHLYRVQPISLGVLSRAVVEADLPNITRITAVLEGREPKPTSPFEHALTICRPVSESSGAVSDFERHMLLVERFVSNINLFTATFERGLDTLIAVHELRDLSAEFENAKRRVTAFSGAAVLLAHQQEGEFHEGMLVVRQEGRTQPVRLGRHIAKLLDMLVKLPREFVVSRTPKEVTYTLIESVLTELSDQIRALARGVETRSTQAPVSIDRLEFVVSNDLADLLTISTSGPWGERNWSSCQRLGHEMGYYKCLAANTKNTLVAYLRRGNEWLGRQVLRVDPGGRVFVERYYGDSSYAGMLAGAIKGHLGAYVATEGVVKGFDFLPYSDCFGVWWSERIEPMFGSGGARSIGQIPQDRDVNWALVDALNVAIQEIEVAVDEEIPF